MGSNVKFIVLLSLLICTNLSNALVPQLTINCKFQQTNRKYDCNVIGLANHDKLSQFSKVIGTHAINKTNELVTGLVIIGGPDITFVPRNVSKLFPNLDRFRLRNSLVKSVERENFEGLKYLETLTLDHNLLGTLSSDVFYNLPQLKLLVLSDNKLTELHFETFSKNFNLEKLGLDGNQLSSVHEKLLENSPALKEIYLQNNQIEELREQLFANNAQLEVINMSNNKLKTIGPELISGLKNLKSYNFTNNDCITRTYETLEDLTDLFKNSCFPPYLKRFEEEIKSLSSSNFELNESLSNCERQHEEVKTSLINLETDLATANEIKSTTESDLAKCVSEKDSIQTNFDKSESDKKQKENELLEVTANLTKCESSEKNFIKTWELTNKNLAVNWKDMKECRLNVEALLGNIKLMEMNAETLEKKLQNFNVTMDDNESKGSQVDEIRMKLTRDKTILSLTQEKEDLNVKVNELQQQKQDLEVKLSDFDNVNKKLDKENTYLIAKYKELQQQKQDLEVNLKSFDKTDENFDQENKKILEKLETAEKTSANFTKGLNKCPIQKPACKSFYISCTFQVIPKSGEYVCRAKHVTACQPGMNIILEGRHRAGNSDENVNVLEIHDSIFYFTDDIFKHLPYLGKIQVKNSGLSTLEPKLKSTNLRELEIEMNSFREIPEKVFSGVRNLNSLLLHNNGIETVFKASFAEIIHLKELSLNDNRISKLPEGVFDELSSLTHLSMVNNRLTSLSGNMFNFNPMLEVVKLEKNNDLKLIGETLLNFSTSLRIFHSDGTCVGANSFSSIEKVKESIRVNCQN